MRVFSWAGIVLAETAGLAAPTARALDGDLPPPQERLDADVAQQISAGDLLVL
jgi:hypothetical protein